MPGELLLPRITRRTLFVDPALLVRRPLVRRLPAVGRPGKVLAVEPLTFRILGGRLLRSCLRVRLRTVFRKPDAVLGPAVRQVRVTHSPRRRGGSLLRAVVVRLFYRRTIGGPLLRGLSG
jgi:hypothetical protein